MPAQKSLKPLIALNIILFVIMSGFALFAFWPFSASPINSGAPPTQIPAFGMASAMHEDGFNTASLKGDMMLLNIFASWCPPCEAEHPVLTALSQDHNIPLYGIALTDKKDDLDDFLKRLGNPYSDIGMDYAGLMMGGLGVQGVPTTFLVDGDLNIIKTWQGPVTPAIADNEILPHFQPPQ
ncbi:MAG: DsbE family thiol:disulfide interchange protein [Micavibrio sp.]|nr:DsbE family thiol:disulfide interchange protein [Micavibrio sp.]|tara:strand:- start:633 stop:1175 length:543 start_codon:yes stop_codon:yes gene_type:complete